MNKINCLFVLLLFACTITTHAQSFKDDNSGLFFRIDKSNKTAVLISGTEVGESKYSPGSYTIPSSVDYQEVSYTVIGIGDNAFYGCSGVYSVVLPETLREIGEWAFYNSDISSVSLPSSVTKIGEYAFALCANITNGIQLSESLETIGRSAFSSSGISSVTIPASVLAIGKNAFASCDNLSSIQVDPNNMVFESPNGCNAIIEKNSKTLLIGCKQTNNLPNDIMSIADNAFYGAKLRDITIPSSVTRIGEWAFYNCDVLGSVEIPEATKSIGEYAFALCHNLNSVKLSSVESIGRSAFSSSGLYSVTIPKSVLSIGKGAFSSCENLNEIVVEEGNNGGYNSNENCNAIIQGDVLVSGCSGTKNIEKLSIRTIGENAFYGSGIKSVLLPNTVESIGEWAFYNCDNLTSIELSNNLKYLEEYAFSLCLNLREIKLPASLKAIDRNAFSNCSKLETVISLIQSPFIINENVFSVRETATLYVPQGTTSIYQQTAGWGFADIREGDPSGITGPTIALQRIYSDNGMLFIESTEANNCNIYSMSGQLMRKLALKKGTNTVSGLTKGIYIINGNKVLVK